MQAPTPPQATGQAPSAPPQQVQPPAVPGSGGAAMVSSAGGGGGSGAGGGGDESNGAVSPWLLSSFERGKIPESAPPAMYC